MESVGFPWRMCVNAGELLHSLGYGESHPETPWFLQHPHILFVYLFIYLVQVPKTEDYNN